MIPLIAYVLLDYIGVSSTVWIVYCIILVVYLPIFGVR